MLLDRPTECCVPTVSAQGKCSVSSGCEQLSREHTAGLRAWRGNGFLCFWGAPQEGEELPRERRGAAADQQQAEQLSPRGHASMSPCPTPVPLSATSPLAGQAASSVLKAGRLQQSSAVGIMGRWQLWRGPRWVGNPLGRRRGPRDPAGMEQCSWMRSRVWCMEELPAPQSWHFTCPKPQLFLQATFV